jgi:hypothetical protein
MSDEKKYLLRIEEDLKLYIARQARLNKRSLNKEIVYRLQRSKLLDGSGGAQGTDAESTHTSAKV